MTFSLSPPTEAHALAERARVLLDLGRPREALPLLVRAAAAEPGNTNVFCLMALAHLNNDAPKACVQAAENAIHAAPNREWGHRLRAHGLMRLGRNRQAWVAAQEAVRCAPHSPHALHTLVLALLRVGRVRDAEQTAHTLRALAPETSWTHEALGLVALRRQRWQDAEGCFRAALCVNPLSHSALNNLGLALRRRGRLPEAMDCFHRATALLPTSNKTAQNLDEAVHAHLFGPLTVTAGVAGGVMASIIWGNVTIAGAADNVGLGVAFLCTAGGMVLHSRRCWQALPPAMQNVIRQRARNFLRFTARR